MQGGKRKFRLPKLELKKFDGDVKNWLGVWGQFKKIDDEEIDLDDKYQYLLQATEPKSSARELVESFPPAGSNYKKAIDQLKTRFAKDEFLIEVYVRELLNLVLKQATNSKSQMNVTALYDKLETQLRALDSLGVTQDKYAAMLFPLVESSLPEDLLKVWERHRNANKINNIQGDGDIGTNYLSLLLTFLRGEVESEERIQLAQKSFKNDKSKVKNIQGDPEMYTAAALYSSGKELLKKNVFPICIFCDKSHASQDCLKAQKLSLEDRKNIVVEKKSCFACLKRGHGIQQCIRCLICSKKHYPLLCPELCLKNNQSNSNSDPVNERKVEQSLTSTHLSQVLLQTIVIKIYNDGEEKTIRALLDSGSQRSYILTKSVKELGFQKISEDKIIQGVFGGQQSSPKIHNIYNVSIKSLKWYFNPPTASWWGRWWERIIRILKELLRRNLGTTLFNYQELETLLCECETVINSRPLTYFTEDSNDLVPLTLSMFINEQHSSEMPDLDIIDRNHLVKRLRYIQKIRESLRTRFRKEYLAELVNIGQKKHETLKVGDIVLIGYDDTKRINWPLGRIEEIFPGKDNVCRVARVKTKNGELLRPFQRLYLMEICSSEIQMEKKNNKEEEILPKKQETTEKFERQSDEKIEDKPTFTRSGRKVKLPDRFKF